ncbi:MAG: hypothetical protein R3F31_15050 [Verrucomicrobiales bacterium]
MKEPRMPTSQDGDNLIAAYEAAERAIPEIRDSNGYSVYPEAINALTRYITVSPWHDSGYSRFRIQEVFDDPSRVGLEKIAAALTCVTRLERFFSWVAEELPTGWHSPSGGGKGSELIVAEASPDGAKNEPVSSALGEEAGSYGRSSNPACARDTSCIGIGSCRRLWTCPCRGQMPFRFGLRRR